MHALYPSHSQYVTQGEHLNGFIEPIPWPLPQNGVPNQCINQFKWIIIMDVQTLLQMGRQSSHDAQWRTGGSLFNPPQALWQCEAAVQYVSSDSTR